LELDNFLEKFLNELRKNNLFRENIKENTLSFIINDYLGLRNRKVPFKIFSKFKKLFTSSASPLLGGYSNLKEAFSNYLKFLYKKEALIFNTGYSANLGVLSSLKHIDNLVILVDKLAHASIYDGILLSKKPFYRFFHNDVNHLEDLLKKLRKKYKYLYVITESIFSMDGDVAPIKDILELKEKYNFTLHIDEAHAFGIYGKNSLGIFENYKEKIDVITITFGKALGSFGSAVLASERFINFLINTSRSYIYSTHIPDINVLISYLNFLYIRKTPSLKKRLFENIIYFRDTLKKAGFIPLSNTPIQPIFIGEKDIKEVLEKIKKMKVQISLIRSPTVPKGKERLRISLRRDHTKKDIDILIENLIFLLK